MTSHDAAISATQI